ncbi:hypothetical protein QUF76_08305 [Desulfobacterales bacterium HSG16]|nr:hypothetical protein [Desulfobacterales bacterium HSG16]
MDVSQLIPMSEAIPVHWGWFKFFLILTFVVHLLFMNAMLGGGIIALASSVESRFKNRVLAKETGAILPFIIAFTVNTGVAPFLFVQVLYSPFIYTSSVLMAVYWLSLVGMLLTAYYSAYIFDYRFDRPGSVFFIAVSVILMLVIGFLFTNNMTLMISPEQWTRYFDNPDGTILNFAEPSLIPRYLHFVISSVAIGGLFQAIVKKFKDRKTGNDSKADIENGMKWFTFATLIQIPVGIWFFMALPQEIRRMFMGQDTLGTILFMSGLVGTVLSLISGFYTRVAACTGWTIATIAIMVLMRDMIRDALIAPYFTVSSLKVTPGYSSLILFLAVLFIGIALVVYMLKLAYVPAEEEGS